MAHNHLADIRAGRITRTNIAGIRKLLSAAWRAEHGYSNSVTSPYGGDRVALINAAKLTADAIDDNHPTAIGALHDSGLAVLRNPRYAKRWNEQQAAVIASPHIRFDLIRFDDFAPHGGHFVPVWRCIGHDGSFLFRNIPWQSAEAYGLQSGPTVETE